MPKHHCSQHQQTWLDGAYLDSQIADLVMKTMQTDGILVVLPIHDGFIVRTGYQRWLKVVMEAAFKTVTGGVVSTDVGGARLPKDFGLTKEQLKDEENKLATNPAEGIVAGSDLDFETLFKETIMKKYLGYWALWRANASNS